jgi:hypothetical protein
MTKEDFLLQIMAVCDRGKRSPDGDTLQAALTIANAVTISAAGMDERFISENIHLIEEATAECLREDFPGAAEAGRN